MLNKKLLVDEHRSRINGPAFRKRRESLGLSLRAVATRAGITETYLSYIERGKRDAFDTIAQKLVAALEKA